MLIVFPCTPPRREQFDSIPSISGQLLTVLLKAQKNIALLVSEAHAVPAQGRDLYMSTSCTGEQFLPKSDNPEPFSRARDFQILCIQFLLSHTNHTLHK